MSASAGITLLVATSAPSEKHSSNYPPDYKYFSNIKQAIYHARKVTPKTTLVTILVEPGTFLLSIKTKQKEKEKEPIKYVKLDRDNIHIVGYNTGMNAVASIRGDGLLISGKNIKLSGIELKSNRPLESDFLLHVNYKEALGFKISDCSLWGTISLQNNDTVTSQHFLSTITAPANSTSTPSSPSTPTQATVNRKQSGIFNVLKRKESVKGGFLSNNAAIPTVNQELLTMNTRTIVITNNQIHDNKHEYAIQINHVNAVTYQACQADAADSLVLHIKKNVFYANMKGAISLSYDNHPIETMDMQLEDNVFREHDYNAQQYAILDVNYFPYLIQQVATNNVLLNHQQVTIRNNRFENNTQACMHWKQAIATLNGPVQCNLTTPSTPVLSSPDIPVLPYHASCSFIGNEIVDNKATTGAIVVSLRDALVNVGSSCGGVMKKQASFANKKLPEWMQEEMKTMENSAPPCASTCCLWLHQNKIRSCPFGYGILVQQPVALQQAHVAGINGPVTSSPFAKNIKDLLQEYENMDDKAKQDATAVWAHPYATSCPIVISNNDLAHVDLQHAAIGLVSVGNLPKNDSKDTTSKEGTHYSNSVQAWTSLQQLVHCLVYNNVIYDTCKALQGGAMHIQGNGPFHFLVQHNQFAVNRHAEDTKYANVMTISQDARPSIVQNFFKYDPTLPTSTLPLAKTQEATTPIPSNAVKYLVWSFVENSEPFFESNYWRAPKDLADMLQVAIEIHKNSKFLVASNAFEDFKKPASLVNVSGVGVIRIEGGSNPTMWQNSFENCHKQVEMFK